MKPINAAQIALALSQTSKKEAAKAARFVRLTQTYERDRLPKDADMQSFTHDLAVTLLQAQGIYAKQLRSPIRVPQEMTTPNPAHSLIGVDQLNDDEFQSYLLTLAPHAVAAPGKSRIISPSPNLVGALLGGLTLPEVERQVYRALTILDAFPDDLPPCMMEALHVVGHGEHVRHNQEPVEITNPRRGASFNWVASLPRTESYPAQILTQGGVQAGLTARIEKARPKVIAYVNRLMCPGFTPYSITEFMHDRLQPYVVDEVDFKAGVSALFEGDWSQLTLGAKEFKKDVPALMARCLLIELCSPGGRSNSRVATLSGQHLVGIAMLTGISVAKWAEFAMKDLTRRGESFLAASAIDEAITIIQSTELDAWFDCESQLQAAAAQLRHADRHAALLAQRLRKPKWPMWTTAPDGGYYALSDDPTYSHAPEVFE